MGTSAEISLLLKNRQCIILTPVDGGFSSCGKDLWEWLGSLTLEQWNTLSERLEKVTW
jgi:hypothetical protein